MSHQLGNGVWRDTKQQKEKEPLFHFMFLFLFLFSVLYTLSTHHCQCNSK